MASLLVPVLSAQTSAEWKKEDPAGDQVFTVAGNAGPVPPPPARHYPYGDLTSLSIVDPHEGFIEFRLRNAPGFVKTPPTTGAFEEVIMHILFQPPNTQAWAVVAVRSTVPAASPQSSIMTDRVAFCVATNPSPPLCTYENALIPFNVENRELVVQVPKSLLTSAGAQKMTRQNVNFPDTLFVGDKLSNVHVRSYAIVPLIIFGSGAGSSGRTASYVDKVPNSEEGSTYALRFGASAPDLEVKALRVGLVAGEETLVPVNIINRAPSKRLLNLTAEIIDGGEGWKWSLTSGLAIGSGKAANATLRVTAPQGAASEGARAKIRIAAAIVNEPGRRTLLEANFVAGPALDTNRATYYLHRGHDENFFTYTSYGETDAFISRYENDANAQDGAPIHATKRGGSGAGGFRFPFDFFNGTTPRDAIPNAATLRKTEPVRGHFEFDVPFDLQGQASFTLFVGEQRTLLATGQKAFSFKTGKNAIDLEALLTGPIERLTTADMLSGEVVLQPEPLVGVVGYFVSFADDFLILPKVSHFTIPLDREAELVVRSDLPRVNLAPAEDSEAFINPGKQSVFEADLLNDDAKMQNVLVAVDNKSADWDVEILPGSDYRLAGNDSARIGILVRAPPDAKEGSKFQVTVAARLRETNELLSVLKLSAIATSGVEIDNETFEVQDDDLKKLASADAKSPSPAFVAAALATLAALAIVRRKRNSER